MNVSESEIKDLIYSYKGDFDIKYEISMSKTDFWDMLIKFYLEKKADSKYQEIFEKIYVSIDPKDFKKIQC